MPSTLFFHFYIVLSFHFFFYFFRFLLLLDSLVVCDAREFYFIQMFRQLRCDLFNKKKLYLYTIHFEINNVKV